MKGHLEDQKNENKKRKDFFMVPNVIIKSGLWARMKPSERAVYQVLCYFAHPGSGWAYPSVAKISDLSGCSKDRVCLATRQLVVYGLITKKRAPRGFKFHMTYKVKKDPKIDSVSIPWNKEKRSPKKVEFAEG